MAWMVLQLAYVVGQLWPEIVAVAYVPCLTGLVFGTCAGLMVWAIALNLK